MIRNIQNSFVAGELDPSIWGRHDLKAYFQGAGKLDNFTVRKAGGVRKRHGTDIALDLTGYETGRIIPFFYDRTRSTLILLHGGLARFIVRSATGALAFAQSGASAYTVAVPWSDEALPSVKYYQIGDTVYLSAPGYQACKLVRYADTLWTLAYMTGITTVQAPTALTASPSGFETSSAYVATTADYALYAIKNGVISQPKKVSAAITLPWATGASVKLAWTPNLASGVDGYLLGKKSGAYYGLLAECYPTRDPAVLTSKTFSTSGVATAAPAGLYSFAANHDTALRATNPAATAPYELKLYHSAYAFHIARSGSADPYCDITPSASAAFGQIRLHLGAYTARTDKQDLVTADYSAAPIGVTLQRWTGSAWTATETFSVRQSAAASGYVTLTVADTTASTSKRRLTFTGLGPDETGVVLRGIAVYNRSAALVATTVTLPVTRTDYFARGVAGHVDRADYFTAMYADVTADTLDRDARTDKSCVPARYLTASATPMALAVAADGGSYYASLRLTAAAAFRISEFRVYLGAEAVALPLRTPGAKASLSSNTAEAVVQYTNNGTDWITLQVGGADLKATLSDQFTEEPVSITVPDDEATLSATGAAVGWGLRIKAASNAPVVLRGCALLQTNVQSTYIDKNDVPQDLIDSQTYLKPGGSTDMSVDVIAMHQQRLVLAAADGLPFSLWFSKAGELGMWYASRPMADDDPFSVSLPATRASRIRHMLADRRLILFTEGGIYTVEGSESEGFSYRTCRISKVANAGVCAVEPVQGTNTVLFIAEDARTLYELRYDLAQDGLIPVDRSVLAAHLTEAAAVVRLAWAPAPDSTVWALLADGTLLAFTYLPEHEVYAWSRCTLPDGVTVTDILCTGAVDETTPGAETASKVYLVATVGEKTFLLKLRAPVNSDTPPVTAAATLDLAQYVHINADGSAAGYEPQDIKVGFTTPYAYPEGSTPTALNLATGAATVLTSGEFVPGDLTPSLPEGNYIIGFPVKARLETLRPELPDRNIQGLAKTVKEALVRCSRARAVSVAPLLNPAAASHSSRAALSPVAAGRVPLASQDFAVCPAGAWNDDGRLSVTADEPWPCEILSVIATLDMEER